MPVVYVIHGPEDRAFVEKTLIRPLPALGFDRWLSTDLVDRAGTAAPTLSHALRACAAILVVVSRTAGGPRFSDQAEQAFASGKPVIPVFPAARIDVGIPALQTLAGVEWTTPTVAVLDDGPVEQPPDPARALADLLPVVDGAERDDEAVARIAPLIGWNEEIFSHLLAEQIVRHDHSRGNALVNAFARHIESRPYPYAGEHARTDLKTLRRKRQFLLMRRYAVAVLASKCEDFQVRRQYGQALIELGDYDRATDVLTQVAEEATGRKDSERYEARGLLGRLHKQQYVNARGVRDAAGHLERAITLYASTFEEDENNVWHGINAASCILRATRDGVTSPPPEKARAIAKHVLDVLERRQREAEADPKKGRLDVWDYATRVEAFVDLEELDAADRSLHEYLAHPGMDAFEVSSTCRQFDEVLQLGVRGDREKRLLQSLWNVAMRLRTGGLSLAVDDAGRTRTDAPDVVRSMLVRVADPQWQPATHVPKVKVHGRVGTVVSLSGTDDTIKALLKDPIVTAIEESRPSRQLECIRSLPFIEVAAEYQSAAGPYQEFGGSALIAVIDNGIDVLHEAFLDAGGKSRIVGIWDQLDATGPPPVGFDFGTYHGGRNVADYVTTRAVPAPLSRANDGHGTHVASIAAGRATSRFFGGVAPEAKLLIVISAEEEPTGYSHAHLNALAFIDQQATALGLPVVVNVSQGKNAGAHDGKSPLESGFNSFSTRDTVPGRVVVKSAGNEFGLKGHAEIPVAQGSTEVLEWETQPARTMAQSTVQFELWWKLANSYRFRLHAPTPATPPGAVGAVSAWVDEANPDVPGTFKGRGDYRLQLVWNHRDNGDNLLKVEVTNGIAQVRPSQWKLEIEAVAVPEAGEIQAWIERGSAPTAFLNFSTDRFTLSIPGTADSVIAVAAVDAAIPIKVGSFSSHGPTRDGRNKPDLAAPGVNVFAAKRDSGNDTVKMSGTSMAAPHVTGAIALVLSKRARLKQPWPTAAQVAAVLRRKTKNYTGNFDRAQGFGVLDVKAFLRAF